MERHVTYIRDPDRTRVIFVFGADEASHVPPPGFRRAADRDHPAGPMIVPADGDDYGAEVTAWSTPSSPPWTAGFAS